ncbi:hypothetical protein LSH36_859g00012 [Paralvinella palmiformis]|uniref:LYR motif-containing protein 2 n=1 Tax=Paralvinella palmiformis TaxID=53620 RepID=A0AAD9IYD6_9ANNE|nr:hypothetical protein LSH36_859g00012 [Paralvinella palmiformis]
MKGCLPGKVLSLKQFMRRAEVLHLYRDILRAVRQIPNETDRKQMLEWARTDFRKNMNETNEDSIKIMMAYGKKTLKQFQNVLHLSR